MWWSRDSRNRLNPNAGDVIKRPGECQDLMSGRTPCVTLHSEPGLDGREVPLVHPRRGSLLAAAGSRVA